MRVLYISDASDLFGAPKALLDILKNICENKVEITPIVLTSKYNEVNKFCEEKEIENYVTGHPAWMMTKKEKKFIFIFKFLIKYFKFLILSNRSLRKAEKYLDFRNIDLIHTNTSIIDLGARISKKYKIKHIWHLREFGQEDYDMIVFKKDYINYMNSNTNLFITISEAVNKCWIKKGIDYKKICMIYDGIKLDDISKRQKNNNFLNIVFSGYISESKGQIQAIKAIEQLDEDYKKRIRLDIIGTGKKEYIKYLKKYIDDKNMSDVIHFLGYKSNLRSLLSQYDIGMMCSKSEGFGRTTVEYMATGLVVIASNTGANKEIICDNENGFIYEYNNIDSLSNLLKRVIDQYDHLDYIAENAITCVNEKFNSFNNFDKIVEKYKQSEE